MKVPFALRMEVAGSVKVLVPFYWAAWLTPDEISFHKEVKGRSDLGSTYLFVVWEAWVRNLVSHNKRSVDSRCLRTVFGGGNKNEARENCIMMN